MQTALWNHEEHEKLRMDREVSRCFRATEKVSDDATITGDSKAMRGAIFAAICLPNGSRSYVGARRGKETIFNILCEQDLRRSEITVFILGKIHVYHMIATKKLRPYFQVHQVTVLTDRVLSKVIAKSPEGSGRMSRWAIKLTKYGLL